MSTPIETIIEGRKDADDETLTESGFHWRESGGLKALVCSALDDAGFVNGFSTRLGGVSPFPANDLNLAGFDDDTTETIAENRRRFLSLFEGDYLLSTVWQVHGDGVKFISSESEAKQTDEKFDAAVSNLNGIIVGVKTADCVPVLIGDTATGAFAAVHAGWRGTAASIVVKTVERMKSAYGSVPNTFICAIGPAASCANYEIGEDVIDAFEQNFPSAEKYLTATRPGHALIDLKSANADQLSNAGVRQDSIFIAPYCTMERTDLFFSYRAERPKYGRTGRMLSVVGRK